MKNKFKFLLLFWIVINALLLIISFVNVYHSGEQVTFITWAYPFGAFVWEDLFIFSFYNIIASVVILFIKDFRYIFVFILSFWLVRAIGETLYWFLQQFNQPAEYPHSQYDWNSGGWTKLIFGNLSDQKYFIIYQIGWQVVTVFCIVGLIYVLKNWEKFGKKVNS